MKKVGIYTTFFEAASGYSLIRVAETQTESLLAHGYDPAVFVQENFKQPANDNTLWRTEAIDLRARVPQMHLETGIPDNFEARVDMIYNSMIASMVDLNVCITHDIIAQEFYQAHNVAMRRYAKERPGLLWLHWIHSVPSGGRHTKYPENCRFTPPPGYIVYPNSVDVGRVCAHYDMAGKEQRVKSCRAGHALDPLKAMRYDPLTKALATKADLSSGEVVVIYPARPEAYKQPDKIIRLLAGVQKAGYEPRLLIIDWQSAGQHFQTFMDEMEDLAESYGLGDKVNFSSRLDDRCDQGVPPHVVTELMSLANVGIFPSRSETYSIVVHENMNQGNLTVLNHDLAAHHDLYGDNAIYMDFGSDVSLREYAPNEQAFWNDEAKRLISELRSNRALWAKTVARRDWSPNALWKDFEALLYLEAEGE